MIQKMIKNPTTKEKKNKQNSTKRKPLSNPTKGHTLYTPKDTQHLRFLYYNINSLRSKTTGKWKAILEQLEKYGLDITGLCETCTNWSNNKKRNLLKKILRIHFKKQALVVSKIPGTHKENNLPGGTCTITTNSWVDKIDKIITDDHNMARWTGTTYRLGNNRKLHYITAYRVIDQPITAKYTLASNSQQHRILQTRNIPNSKPRSQFIIDFITQFQQLCTSEKDYFILTIDANETMDDNENNGLQQLIQECNLVNMNQTIHKDYQQFPTHQNGSKTIDFAFCTNNVIPYIKQIGYIPFNEILDSDHRGIFFDLDISINHIPDNNYIPKQRLVGTNSTNQEGNNYVNHLHKHLVNNNIFNKIKFILEHGIINNKDTTSIHNQINQIDQLITKAKIQSEKSKCQKKGPSKWFPELLHCLYRIQYWNIIIKGTRQKINTYKRIKQIFKNMTEDSKQLITNCTKSPTRALRQEAKNYILFEKNGEQYRAEHLHNKYKEIAERDKTQKTSIRQLIQREQSRYNFRCIKKALKQKRSQGIRHIEIPREDDPNKTEQIHDPKIIEDKFLLRNIQHFSQAEKTPFTTENLLQIFEYEGTNNNSQQLMQSGIIPENISKEDKYTQQFVEQLSMNNTNTLANDITIEEFQHALIKWNDKTTTSPSGRHLGHYKLLQRLKVQDNDSTPDKSQDLINLYYNIMKIAILIGKPLQRWTEVTTVMIEKIPGNPKIDKMRVIHLFEVDYNLILKVMWARKTIWKAYQNNILNQGQAGSKPGSRAIDVVLNKEMKYTYAKLTRTPIATIDNDTKSCIDRILCNVAMLISQHFGVPQKICELHATTLKQTTFKIRTALGDSTRTYQHTKTTPIHGTGQGSCSSPAIWLMISSFLMDLLNKNAHGIKMHDFTTTSYIQQWIEGFVDDTSIFTNLDHGDENLNKLKEKIQHDGQIWANFLRISGGSLEMSKCFFYILSWKWDKWGNPYPQTIQEQNLDSESLNIINADDNSYLIQKESSESHKTLGTYKCLYGKETDHIQYLTTKSDNYATKISNSQLNRKQSRLAYNTTYLPAMTYSLLPMNLNEKTLDAIQCKATTQFTRKFGFEMTFPKDIVHSPLSFGGLGVHQLYTECYKTKMHTLKCHTNIKPTSSTENIIININLAQIHSGRITPIFESKDRLEYVQDHWFEYIRNFIHELNGKLIIKNIWHPTLSREYDKTIMQDYAYHIKNFNEWKCINNWRLYLQVTTIADITTYNGKFIRRKYLNRNKMKNLNPKLLPSGLYNTCQTYLHLHYGNPIYKSYSCPTIKANLKTH
jgi:hypothetical protein